MESIALEKHIWIDAPPERVWRAITDPDKIAQWFAPGMKWRSEGMHVGARMALYDPATDVELAVQMVELVDPPHQLVTRQVPPLNETAHTTTWKLTAENGGTRLTLIYAGFELEPAATRAKNMRDHGMGFEMVLENIKALIEGKPLPQPGGF